MKRILLLFFMFVLAMTAVAQRTQKITYQAVVRDRTNRLVVYTPVRVDVTITSSTGSYFESLRDTTNANGLMYVLIGGNPGFEDIDWVEAVIKTVITIEGGETVSDEVTVTAVPFALQANYATNVSPTAPTIVAVYNQLQADSLALANQIAAERAHLDDTLSHYLMQEVQVLSISNDTIYLTGGSFVKLPAGFSGDYNDLIHKPDLTQYVTNVHLNDTLGHYPTIQTLNDTLSHYLMHEEQVLSVSNDTLYLTGGSWVKLPQGFSGDYNDLANKPDLNQYTTNAHLNDTLSHYYTNTKINDTLAHYLRANDLCDSIVKCDIFQNMRDSIQINATNIANNTTSITNNTTNITNNTTNITNITNNIANLQLVDSTLEARIVADSANLANNYYNKDEINDTLSHYLKEEVQALRISNDTIYLTGGSFVKLPAGFSGDYNDLTNAPTKSDLCDSVKPCVTEWISDSTRMVFDTLHSRYTTLKTLSDSLRHYTTLNTLNDTLNHYIMEEVQALRISNDTIYLTGGSFVKLPAGFSGDYNDLTNAPTNVSAFNNDAGYLTSYTEVQALRISNDTIYLTGGSFVKLPAGFSGDYNELINRPNLDQYATNTHLNDTLGHYLQAGDLCDSIVKCGVIQDMRDSILTNATNITNVQTDINNITGNIINLLNVDSVLAAHILSDSVLFYKTDSIILARIIADSTNLANNYYNKDEINDTLSHYLLQEVQALRISNDTIYLTGGSFVKLPAGFSGDYNDLTNAPTNVSAFNNDAGYLTSYTEVQTLRISNDTIYLTGGSFVKLPAGFSGDYNELINRPNLDQYATNTHLNDTLGHYLQAGDLCDSIVKCGVIQDMRDSILTNATNITNVQTDINNITGNIINLLNVDSVLAAHILSDSVLFYKTDSIILARIIADSTNLANNYYNKDEINDTLSHYLLQEVQALRISNDTIYLTGGSFVKLPAGFSGDYNDLTNVPTNVSAFNNDAGYLTSYTEVQALRISNDTIYLTGGSFVKLPAGFSGDYNDLTNAPTNVSAFNNDAGYLTSDSAVIVNLNTNVSNLQGDVTTLQSDVTNLQNADNVLSSRITTDSTALANRMDTLLKHVCDSVKPCVTGWISDSTRMVFDTLHSRYTTLKTLSDSLRHYTTLNTLNDTLSHYLMQEVQALRISNDTIYLTGGSFVKLPAGFNGDYNELINRPNLNQYVTNTHLNDTLGHYLQVSDLCDSIMKCGAIQNMHDSIQINTTNISNNTTNITNITNNITSITTDLHAVDSILNARITTDSTALANRIHIDSTALATRMDTLLKHVCDSVQECVTGWISDSTRMIFDTLHGRYTTLKTLHDSLSHYTTTNQIDTLIKKYGYLTSDSAVIVMMRDSIQKVNAHVSVDSLVLVNRIVADSTALAHRMDTLLKHVCDSVQECVTGWISDSTRMIFDTLHGRYTTLKTLSDTLSHYTTTNQIDTLIKKYGYLTSDSAVIVMMRDSIQKVNAHVVADSLAIMDTLHYYYATNAHLNDTLGHYTTTDQIDTLLNKHHYLTSDSTVIVTMRDSIYKVNNRLTYDSTALAHRMDTLLKHVCDSVQECVTNWMGDTLKAYTTTNQIDTLLGAYVTNAHLNDTLSHYYDTTLMKKAIHDTANVLRGQIPVVNNGQITIKVNNQGTEEVNTFGVNQANDQLITITIPAEVAVNNGQLTIIAKDDTTRFTANQAINDTVDLSGFATIALLNDTLKAYTTTNKIDTLIKKYGYLTSDSAVIVMMRDSIQKVNAHVVADSLAIMDTLHYYYATNAHLNDTLGHYTTTDQIDTLLNKHHYLTSDSTVIVMMRDSIYKVNNRLTYDSTALAHRMDTLLKHVCDSVQECVTNWMGDTLKAYTTTNKIDTLIQKYGYLTSDSAVIVMMRDSIQKVNAHVVADSLAIMDTLHYYYVTNAHLNDTLGHYTTTDQIDTLLNKHHYLTSDSTVIVTMRDSIYKVNNRLTYDSTALAHRMDTLLKHVCDSVQECVTNWMGDTLKAYTTTNQIDTLIKKYGYLTSDSAVIVMMRDSIQKVNAHVVADSLAIMDTLHKYYATNDTLNNYYTRYQVDTAKAHIRNEIQNGALTITYGGVSTTFTANQPTGSNVTVEIPTPAEQVQANWNETDASSKAYIQNKPDLTVYATKDALKDSTRMVYDTLHRYYATKDTLKNFLTISGLCDSVMSCDGIENMRDSIQKVNAHVVADSLAIMDTLHRYYVTNAHLNDTLEHYTTTDQIDTLLNKHHYLTSDSTVIVMMRDSIQKVNAHVVADSVVIMDTLHRYYATKDTLKNFLTISGLCDSVMSCDGIERMRDSIQKVNAHVVADSLAIMDTLHRYYVTNAHLNDTLGHYTTTDQIDTLLNKHHYLTSDSTVIVMMRDSIYKVNNRLTMDSTALAHRMDTLLKHVCDSVQECVTGWIKDSTRMVFDTLHTRYTTLKSLNDTLGHYTTTNQIDTLIKKYGYLTSDSAVIVTMRDSIQKVNAHVSADSLVLAGKIRTDSTVLAQQIRIDSLALHNALIDTAAAIRNALIDTAAAIRAAMPVVNDGTLTITVNGTDNSFTANQSGSTNVNIDLTPYATKVELHNDSVALGTAISDLTAKVATDSLALVNRIVTDSTALATRMDTLLKHVCDSVKPCVTELMNDTLKAYTTTNKIDTLIQKYGFATNAHLNDTLGRYTTTNQIDTLIRKYGYLTSDSAVIVMMRDSIQKVNAHVSADSLTLATRIVADSTALAHRMDTLLKHVCDSVKPCVTDWMNDTLKAYTTTNKIDTLIQKYGFATNAHLNDTLKAYTTTDKIDTLIRKYGYLTSDSAVIVMMRDSIQKVNAHVSADSLTLATRIVADSTALAHRMDTLLKHVCDSVKPCVTDWMNDTLKAYTTTNKIDTLIQKYGFATNAHLNDTLKVYTTTDKIDTLIRKYGYLTSDSAVIVMMRDSIQKVNAHVSADSMVLAKRIVADSTILAHRMDTLLKHVCDSVKPCVTDWMNDTLKAYTTTNKIDTLIQKYGFATNAHLNDTLRRYTTTNQIDTLIRKYGYLTSDSAVIVMMRDSIQKVNAHVSADSLTLATRIVADSTALAHRMDTLLKHVCDSVKPCVTDWMNDTLKAYTTTNKIDTLIQKYGFATNAHLNDTLRRYTTTNQIDTLIKKYGYLTSDSAVIVMMRDSIQKVNAHVSVDSLVLVNRIVADSTALAHRMDTLLKHVCDSVQECVTGWISDSTRMIFDTLHGRYTTLKTLNDSLSHYTTTNQIDTLIKKYGYLTSDSAVIVMMRDSIQKVNAHVSADSMILAKRIVADSTILAHRMDTLLKHVCDSVKPCVTDWMNDTLKAYTTTNKIDTLIQKYGFATNAHLNDTMRRYTTTNQIDTLIKKYGYLTSDSAVIVMMRDSIQKVNAHVSADSLTLATRIVADSTALAHRMDTLLKHVCDSVKPCVTGWISDSTRMIFDTLHKYYTNLSTLADSMHRVDVRIKHDSLEVVELYKQAQTALQTLALKEMADSLTLATRMDTVYKHLCDSVMNCDGIKTMQTNITDVTNNLDSSKTNIRNEISSLNTKLQSNIDSTSQYVRGALKDTATAIRKSIGNGTLTIQYGTDDPVTFNANQKTDTSIIIPVPTAPNDATLTIQKNGTTIGTFTANQAADQTIDITVPTCDSLAECDLIKSILARLDKLERQNDSLAKEIEKLQPALTVNGPQKDTVCSNSTKTMTYTATFHNCSSSDYTLAWKVNGTDSSAVTGATLTLNVKEGGAYKVVCIATRSDSTFVTDTVTTMVTVDDAIPSFTASVTNLTVELTDITNTATIQWDTDSLPVPFSGTSATHTYSVADTITITVTSKGGCTFYMGLRLQATEPVVTTDSVNTITATTAKAYGTVISDGGVPETKRGVVYSTSDQNLELGADGVDSVMSGTGMGSFTCNLTRLVPCTQYYVRAFAYNEVDTAYGEVKDFTTPSFTCGSTLTDIDGNEYATLLLGSQCWMNENLRTTHFADGTEIQLGESTDLSYNSQYRFAPDSWSSEDLVAYGYLYNWAAAMHGSSSSAANPSGVQGICPDGWHLPRDAEWTQLFDFVASNAANVCGGNPKYIAKSLVSQERWSACQGSDVCEVCDNLSANNNTGFSLQPAGVMNMGGGIAAPLVYDPGYTIFLSATEYYDDVNKHYHNVWTREIYNNYIYVDHTATDKRDGLSIRCVLDCATGHAYPPTVSAVKITNTSGTTVNMEANVDSDGGATVTERGVCWGTSSQPTVSGDHIAADVAGIGEFAVTGNLTAGTTYYVRAYATNSEGTAYGAEVTFIISVQKFPPTVNTGSKFLALTEGFEDSTLPSTWTTIDNDGDGHNWYQLFDNPHSGSGCASSVSTALVDDSYYVFYNPNNYLITPDITIPTGVSPILTFWYSSWYYNQDHFLVKVGNAGASSAAEFNTQVFEAASTSNYAKATVNLISYAGQTIRLAFVHQDQSSYNTNRLCIDDIVVGEAGAVSAVVSDITGNSAVCGGYVSNDGGATVTARGVCWSTNENPTISDSHTTDDGGTGSFTSEITGLNALTTYYVRAYATNSAGTTYGDQVSFTTTEALPEVTTSAVSNITATTATCGGNVTDQGVSAVTARGVCWSTSENPTVSNSHTTDGSGMYSFTSNITGLSSGTTYYVRAYATNSAGTAYGNQVSFTLPVIDTKSCPEASTVTDHEGNVYATVQIGTLCWMRENLRTTTSPKTGTYLVNKSGKCSSDPVWVNTFSFMGSKVVRWPNSDSTTSVTNGYGLLYNWCAAMDTANPTNYVEVPTSSNTNGNNTEFTVSVTGNYRGICPAGWHLPNSSECDSLNSYSISNLLADGDVWSGSPDNASGFTALPARYFGNCTFYSSDAASFWGCTTHSQNEDQAKSLYLTDSQKNNGFTEKNYCLSVRCVRDGESGGGTSLSAPEVSTGTVSAVTTTSATAGGEVTSDGGASVSGRGVCWNTLHNPTISDSHTTDGNGTGSFTSTLTGLIPGTTYYVRAYAINSEGTTYGNERSFTTLSGKRILLDTITQNFVAQHGDTLVNTWEKTSLLEKSVKISILDGAEVTLKEAAIYGTNDSTWAGITCLGNATIFLEGTNIVKGFYEDYPGIYVAPNKTLTIQGTDADSLNVRSNGWGAGIGGGVKIDCGNIIVGGGKINAVGGQRAAGIGSGQLASCGNININQGKVTSLGGQYAAGIGSGESASCGSITINGGKVNADGGDQGAGIGTGIAMNAANTCGVISLSGGTVVAHGGDWGAGVGTGAAYNGKSNTCDSIKISGETDITATGKLYGAGVGAGMGNGNYASSICGVITISGGTVIAQGGARAAGIGSGRGNNGSSECGNINISGGTVKATGGSDSDGGGTGIGTGYPTQNGSSLSKCGNIAIESGVTRVEAVKGFCADNSIGKDKNGSSSSTCGTVTIGGTGYGTGISTNPYVYEPTH